MKTSHDFVVKSDERGSLKAFDNFGHFDVRRFYIIDCIKGMWRGNHYHKLTTQMIFVLEGKLQVEISKDGITEYLIMNQGDMFVQLPYNCFKFCSITENSRLIVLCDKEHDVEDYYQ